MVWCIPLSIRCRGPVWCQTGGGFKWFLYSPLQSVAIKPEHSLFWEIPSWKSMARWWQLKCLFIFTPKIGEDEPTHFEGYIFFQMGWKENHQLEIMDKSRFASTLKINWFFRLERFDIHIKLVVLDFLACIWIYPIGGYHLACTRWFVFC